jgi:type IV secretory pathway TrbF-like protein
MESYKVRWVENGEERESVVSYDRPSAEDRVMRMELYPSVTNIRIVPVDLLA